MTFARLVPWYDIWQEGVKHMNEERSPVWDEIRAEEARESLITLLKQQFGAEVARELTPSVQRMKDLDVLRRCVSLIIPRDLPELRRLLSTLTAAGK